MAVLTSKKRDHLKSTQFALPAEHKYPIPDKAHAINAKARAKQQYERGKLSKADYDKIVAAADRVIKGK